MAMSEPSLFVPIVESKNGLLYRIHTFTPAPDPWMINNYPDYKFTAKIKACIEGQVTESHTAATFSLIQNGDNKPFFEELTENTQSVYLGLFFAAYRHIRHLRFKDGWDSITVTGDLSPHDGIVDLKAVGDIHQKYTAVIDYAKNHPGQHHLFLYVSGEPFALPETPDNLEVKAVSPDDSPGEVIAFLFEPHLDERQQQLFNWAVESLSRQGTYVETEAFNRMKQEARSCDWKGYLIHGEGETGKSAIALELAYWLAEREYIYAPIWVNIDNESLIAANDEHLFKLQEKHGKKTNPVTDYIARQIADCLQVEWSPEKGLRSLAEAIQRKHCLLVIDNLELEYNLKLEDDLFSKVVNAVRDCILQCSKKPPVIITSRLKENDPEFAERKLGLRVITPPEFTVDKVDTLVRNIAKGKEYEKKLATDTNEYNAFIEQLYTHFKSFPGLIRQIVPMLTDYNLYELRQILLNMGNGNIREKAEKIYRAIFSRMKLSTKAVLFAFIGTTKLDDNAPLTEQHGTGKTKVADQIVNSCVDPSDIELPDEDEIALLEEQIASALRELDHRHLIYQTKSKVNETSYAMKSLAYVTFMFAPKLCGCILPSTGETLRNSLIYSGYMVTNGLKYGQSVEIITQNLDRLKKDMGEMWDGCCNALHFLHTVAQHSSNPNYIDLLLLPCYDMDINYMNIKYPSVNQTPLHRAAKYNQNIDILNRFLDKGAEINAKDKLGMTPLHIAAMYNTNIDVIRTLIDRDDADIYATYGEGDTLLHAAAANPNQEVIKFLIILHKERIFQIVIAFLR
jgi:hypothetical protein